MGYFPPAFFLNSSMSFMPARSQASRMHARSSASSICASASALSKTLDPPLHLFPFVDFFWFFHAYDLSCVSVAVVRAHLATVLGPLIPYFFLSFSKGIPPSSNSRTTVILKNSLYLVADFLTSFCCLISDNLFQDGTHTPKLNAPRSTVLSTIN